MSTESGRDECEHGSLRRKCLMCELNALIADQVAEVARLRAEVVAAEKDRDHADEVLGSMSASMERREKDLQEEIAGLRAERDAARARAEALDAEFTAYRNERHQRATPSTACSNCNGVGYLEIGPICAACHGTGTVDPARPV